jgi:Heavy metal associated domain 2
MLGAAMLEYVHFVPGRLRLKISELRHRRRAAEAETVVVGISGVSRVVANPITGSLTITFDPKELSIRDLWERLRVQGYVSDRDPTSVRVSSVEWPDTARFGRALMAGVLDAIVQHSAQLLVRALL